MARNRVGARGHTIDIPLRARPQLELGNLLRTGELSRMWFVAKQTDLTFNLVGGVAGKGCVIGQPL